MSYLARLPRAPAYVGWSQPWAPAYVGASVDVGAIEDKKAKADEAKKQSDKALAITLETHAAHDSALAANAYSVSQWDDLRALSAVAVAIFTADPSGTSSANQQKILAWHDEAKARLTYLGIERQQILGDQAAHAPAGPPVFVFPPNLLPKPAYDPGGGGPFFADLSKSFATAQAKTKYANDLGSAALAAHHSQQAALDACNDAIAWWTKVQTDASALQSVTLGQPDKKAKLQNYGSIAADRIAQLGALKQELVDDLSAHGPEGGAPPPSGAESELSHRIGTVFLLIGLGAAVLFVAAPVTAALIVSRVRKAVSP